MPQYTDELFLDHCRVSRHVANEIADRVNNSEYYLQQSGEFGKLDAMTFTLIFLWFCGHEAASFRDVSALILV